MKIKQADSKLVTFLWAGDTSHYNTRTAAIDRITIHHAANGSGCNKGYSSSALNVIFESVGRKGSVQYGIDSNGRIGQMLAEKYRCWCSDSRANDMRSICMEICNNSDTYSVSDKALAACIDLCVDICQRNGKKKLLYFPDKTKSLNYKPASDEMIITLHKWLAATPCPEKYLTSKMPYIAETVTARLNPEFKPYLIKVTYNPFINIRSGPGVNFKDVGDLPYGGVYTIVDEKVNGTQTWGRLKSGAGWICLTGYTQKIK